MAAEAPKYSESKPVINGFTNESKNDTEKMHNNFMKPLRLLSDHRAITLLHNILSKIIQNPNDQRRRYEGENVVITFKITS